MTAYIGWHCRTTIILSDSVLIDLSIYVRLQIFATANSCSGCT